MTLNNREASQASSVIELQWRRVAEFKKVAGDYSIRVIKSRGEVLSYQASYFDHLLAEFTASNNDTTSQVAARDNAEAACSDHANLLNIRAKAYAAAGGVRLAKTGHAIVTMLSRQQLEEVITNPDTLIDLASQLAGPPQHNPMRAQNTACFGQ